MKEIILGWTASTRSGIGKILLPLKYWAYLALSLAWSFGEFFVFWSMPTRRQVLLALFGPGGIKLAVSDEFVDSAGDDGNKGYYGFLEGVLRPLNKSVAEFLDGTGSCIVA